MDYKYEYTVKVTPEEFAAMSDLDVKMRKEKAKQQAIIDQEQQIGAAIGNAISVIGLEETKRIVRNVTRDLRKKTDDPCDNY